MKKLILFVALCVSLGAMSEEKNGIIYVKQGATGTGASWADAMGDIQAAITLAKTVNDARKDVWVAGGNYTIAACISIIDSVNVYGSFAGTETAVTERAKVAGGRAWEFVTPTILDGGNASRLFQVAANPDMPTTIDGFTLTNGNGVGSYLNNNGGGIVMRPNLILQNSIVQNCTASNGAGGGVMFNGGGIIRDCLVKNNSQSTNGNGGGGIYLGVNSAGGKDSFIENCVVTGNTTTVRGGGIATNGASATITVSGCEVFNNKAINGTTLLAGGGVHVNQAPGIVKNCLIYNNSGATALYYNGGRDLYNNTIVKNLGGVYVASVANISNNLVWGCFSDVEGSTPANLSGNANTSTVAQNNATYYPIPADKDWTTTDNILFSSNWSNGDVVDPPAGSVGSGPKFNYETQFHGAATTPEELLQLDSVNWSVPVISPCVNMGKNLPDLSTDIVGVARPQGFPIETALADIGAYELPYYNVVAGEAATSNGEIYNALGTLLTENTVNGYAKGDKVELFFQPKNGYLVERAYYTASTDGGTTFTGAETDFTTEITTDGFWTGVVSTSFKVSAVWKSATALKEMNSDKIRILTSENGVQITGLTADEMVSVYQSNGMLMHQARAKSNSMNVALSKGVYILRVADSAKKLVIK